MPHLYLYDIGPILSDVLLFALISALALLVNHVLWTILFPKKPNRD